MRGNKKEFIRRCRRCQELFTSTSRFGKICKKCILPLGVHTGSKNCVKH